MTSGLPPADEVSTRTSTLTSGFTPLLKPFLWASTLLPGIAWRKTKPSKAGAEEEPSSKPIATLLDAFSRSKLDALTRTRSLPVMSKDAMTSVHRSSSMGRMIAPARATLGGALDATSPHRHRAKGAPPTGAGARLLDRVHELRAREAAAKVEHPTNYGMVLKKAAPVAGFEWTSKFSPPRALDTVGSSPTPPHPRRVLRVDRPKDIPLGEEERFGGDQWLGD